VPIPQRAFSLSTRAIPDLAHALSTLTWLAFSDAERRRALPGRRAARRSETRDELGVGALREAFAEAPFPGMSTVQRRARYFLFVPWIFRDVER